MPAEPATAGVAFDVAVVCSSTLLPALRPWIEYRKHQGYRLAHIDSRYTADQIRGTIRQLARPGRLRYVVLVGDADPEMATNRFVRERSVPTFYSEAKVVTRYGSEPLIPSDNPYADLDDDKIPDVAVGRLSVDDASELTLLVQKILRYEQPASGPWQQRVDLVAGVGDFGAITDAVVEAATRKFITDGIPASFDTHMTYANWRSPYCPDPRQFRETVLDRFSEGSLFWVYVGHGRPRRLDRVHAEDLVLPILEAEDVTRIQSRTGLPIAVMLACYTGAYDQPVDCLGESMVGQPAGPIAAICGSRVTTPYGMALFASGLLEGYFARQLPTLGEIFLYAKKSLGHPELDASVNRKLMDSLAKTFSPTKDNLAGERDEHQLLMNLLGDPLLRLPYPESISVQCQRHVTAGETLRLEGTSSVGGSCQVELFCRRDLMTSDIPPRRQLQVSDDFFHGMQQQYLAANQKRWTRRMIALRPGAFAIELPVPERAAGSCHVRISVHDGTQSAVGTAPVYIQAPEPADPTIQANAQRAR